MRHHRHGANAPIVIVGLGRLGRMLAGRLSVRGDAVVAVDQRALALEALPASFSGFRVRGDAGELGTLERARFAEASLVFASTDDDNLNLMVAQAARYWFEVPRALARVSDPTRQDVYGRLGIETLNATQIAADAFMGRIDAPAGRGGRP